MPMIIISAVLLAEMPDWFTGSFGAILMLLIAVGIVISIVAFFRGPATAAERHAQNLSEQLASPADAALFHSIYRSKNPRSTLAAWLLTIFLSPTISYIYQNRWIPAAISFLTIQGLGLWWVISWFTMPSEVAKTNMRLADEAFNQVMLARPGAVNAPTVAPAMPPIPSVNAPLTTTSLNS